MSHKLRIGMTHRRSHIEGPGMQGMKGKHTGTDKGPIRVKERGSKGVEKREEEKGEGHS